MNTADLILQHVFDFLALVVSLCIPPLTRSAIAWIEAKTKVHVDEAQAERLDDLVFQAVHYAEEQARKAAIAKVDARKLPANEKLDLAVGYVLNEIDRNRLPALAASRVARLVEAKLAYHRLEPTPVPVRLSAAPQEPAASSLPPIPAEPAPGA